MRPYQIKYFNQGKQSVMDDLNNGIPIKANDLISLINETLSAQTQRTEMSEQVVHRDADNLEMLGSTTEKFQAADAIGHDLAGRIRALVDFANCAIAIGVRVKPKIKSE